MSSYVYKAKNTAAQTITGRIDAQNQDEALETIYSQGLVPVSIEEETAQGIRVSEIRPRQVKSKEIYLFTKQLAGLVKSGVALLKALDVISQNTRNVYMAKIVSDTVVGVKTGRSFSSCLADYPSVFSPFYLAMVRVGEEMGHVKDALLDLSVFQKRQEEMSAKVRGALVYPALMLAVGSVTVLFILTFVMPKIAGIFVNSGQMLPWPTRMVMAMSHFLQAYWAVVLLAVTVCALAVSRWRSSAGGRLALGHMALKLPFFRDLILKADVARFGRSMYLLLHSGLPLVRALEVCAPTLHSAPLRRDILHCVEALNAGETLGACLRRSAFFPEVFAQTLTIAEESGSLEEVLKDIADSCEADVNEALKGLTTLIEPLMILGVGLVVGFIVFSMLLPIFSMDLMAQ